MRMLIFLATVAAQLGVMFYVLGILPIPAAMWLGVLGVFAIAMRSQNPDVRRLWRPLAVLATIGGVIFLGFYFRETVRNDFIFATLTAITTITLATQLQLFQTYKPVAKRDASVEPGGNHHALGRNARVSVEIVEKWKAEAIKLQAEVAEKNQHIRELKTRVAQLEERVARQNRLLAQVDDPFADDPRTSPKGA